jgi:hypothetical protein
VAPPDPGEEGTRLKGGARLAFYVKRGTSVLPGIDGQVVYPGDQLRFTVSNEAPEHLAILSLDGASVASVYFPSGPDSASLGRGRDQALDSSVELDATLGRERLWAVFCVEPFRTEPLREQLEREGNLPELAHCTIDSLSIVKEPLP